MDFTESVSPMNFSKTFTEDIFYCGQMDLPHQLICQQLEQYVDDETRTSSLINSEDKGVCDQKLYEKQNQYAVYGYTCHNTKIWKTTNIEHKLTFDWEKQICKQLPLVNAVATVTRQDPGQSLPWHRDEFFYHRKFYPDNTLEIWRFLVFLSDWKLGHFVQANDTVYHHWRFGDTIVWRPETMHLTANIGLDVKWTCNITGHLTL
jgi:hypothetical protein